MKRVIRIITATITFLLLIAIAYFNFGLYYSPNKIQSGDVTIDEDLLAELRFLRSSIEDGSAEEMQHLFPEGYVFMNALYGIGMGGSRYNVQWS